MSFMTHPERLDPRTVTDIRENACDYCDRRPVGRWSICDFHEGYEAALEQHASTEEPR